MKTMILAVLFSLGTLAARADAPAVHGMLLFGNEATYASHLPMFHSPHDYQLLLRLSLVNAPRSQALERYASAKAAGEALFTLVPEVMDLVPVVRGARVQFSANVYEGHFESGGKNLGPVKVMVDQILFAAKLNEAPASVDQYLVFGGAGEYFAAHLIKEKPSFDWVAQVGQPYWLGEAPCRTQTCRPRMIPIDPSKLPLALSVEKEFGIPRDGDCLGGGFDPWINVRKVIYVEEAELSRVTRGYRSQRHPRALSQASVAG